MPPKAKFTKDEIIKAALDIVRTEGMQALTARALGLKLGSSARPVFTVFETMEEVQQEVIDAAKQVYKGYVNAGLEQTEHPKFKGVGIQYIAFAIKEPKLFQILFMSEQFQKVLITNVLPHIEDSYSEILFSVQECYDLNENAAEKLYRHLWIYTHGIAALYATNMCMFSAEEVSEMLTEVCMSLLKNIKAGNIND